MNKKIDKSMSKADKKNEIINKYIELTDKLQRAVAMNDLIEAGYTKDVIVYYFRSLSKLDDVSRAKFPNKFSNVSVKSLIGPKALNRLQGAVKKHKIFIVTTAVTGCSVENNFYKSIKNYCKLKDAELLILVQSDPAHNMDRNHYGYIDRTLANEQVVVVDTALNSNVYISTIKLSAKQIDPITGLGRIGQRNGSFIYASPKQRLKPVPVSNSKFPHFLMTTGAITTPNYNTHNYMSERTAHIAENDHVVGALIVEVEDDDIFHFRQIQADEKGYFIDLGVQYKPNSTKEFRPEAIVLGDWHSGETDPTAKKAWFEVIEVTKPKQVIMHDVFNGMSINHHEEDRRILKAQRALRGELDLAIEIQRLVDDLDEIAEKVEKVVIVKSNHDDFLERYLQDGKYVSDPYNHRFALDLAIVLMDGNDPLQAGCEGLGLRNTSKIKWLKRDEDYKIARIQLGAHGDKGANGAKGSLMAMEAAYGNSVTGHSHSPEILRGAWSVGTSSYLKLTYNSGPSSWLHTSVLVYSNGSRQSINSICGKWRL